MILSSTRIPPNHALLRPPNQEAFRNVLGAVGEPPHDARRKHSPRLSAFATWELTGPSLSDKATSMEAL